MAIIEGARLHKRHSRQISLGDGVIEIERILEMRRASRLVGHRRGGIEERIANIAIEIGDRGNGTERDAQAGGRLEVVPTLAEIRPGHVGRAELIADVALFPDGVGYREVKQGAEVLRSEAGPA